jgi:hypothetical protein
MRRIHRRVHVRHTAEEDEPVKESRSRQRLTLPFEADAGQTVRLVPAAVLGTRNSGDVSKPAGHPDHGELRRDQRPGRRCLGRNLGRCGTAATCNGTVTVANLFAPNTLLGDRLIQVDVRLSKRIHVGRARLMAMLDVYNLFNASTITAVNTRYGPAWLQPLAILPARLFKVGAQLDF